MTRPADELERLADRLLSVKLFDSEDLLGIPRTIGRYEVLRLLGEGAAGRVFLARDPELGREVAIKVLSLSDEEGLRRFRQEQRVLGALKHPNIVDVFDAGQCDEGPFLVMEHVPGATLATEQLELREVVRVLQQVALACHAAHQVGVIHHDLKPGNILLGDRPVVADYGVAKVLGDPGRTRTGMIVGTPAYMAPEQIAGRRDEPRSDVYALGAMLYEQLTGRPPYTGATALAVLAKVAAGDPPSPREIDPGIPEALERIVLRAMARDLDQRYATALELSAALSGWLRGPLQRSGTPWLLLGGVTLLAAALVAVAVRGTRSPSPSLPTPPPTSAPTTSPTTSPPTAVSKTLERLDVLRDAVRAWERAPAGADDGMGQLEQTGKELRSLLPGLEAEPRGRAEVLLAAVELHRGRTREAGRILKSTSGVGRHLLLARVAWRELLATREPKAAQWEEVLTSLREAPAPLGSPWARAARGAQRRDTASLRAALERLQREESPEAVLLRGEIELLVGQATARRTLERASRLRGTRIDALLGLVRLHLPRLQERFEAARYRSALRGVLRLVKLVPAELAVYRTFNMLVHGLSRPRAAARAVSLEEHLPILRAGPEAAPVATALGVACVLQGYRRSPRHDPSALLAEGIAALKRARALDSEDSLPPSLIGLAYAVWAGHRRASGLAHQEQARLAREWIGRAAPGPSTDRFRTMIQKLLSGGR